MGELCSGRKDGFLGAYRLGKAQRLLSMLDPAIGPILTHGAVENTNAVLRGTGHHACPTRSMSTPTSEPQGPSRRAGAGPTVGAWAAPGRDGSARRKRAFASGWMALRGVRRRRAAIGALSSRIMPTGTDCYAAIKETGAENIYVTHGYTDIFTRYLNEKGWTAQVVPTEFEGETLDDGGGGMKAFAALFNAIDQSTKTTIKVAALADYFADAPEDRPAVDHRAVFRPPTQTRRDHHAAARMGGRGGGHPAVAVRGSYPIVGDLAETIALVLPPNTLSG